MSTDRPMRIEVDRDRCEGHGMCEVLAPDFFELDDDGEVVVLQSEVPAGAEPIVRGAVRGCPVASLRLVP